MKNNLVDFEEEVDILEEIEINKSIVIRNDEVNSFQHVVDCLVKYCEQTYEQAEQCAMIIHTKGKYAVKSGVYDDLKPIRDALTENGIDAVIQ